MKQKAFKLLPWVITVLALYFAFQGIDLGKMLQQMKQGNFAWLSIAIFLTISSYLIRAFRWQFFFPAKSFNFLQSYQVLTLGFFMNNILPARAGEFIRAHLGAKISSEKRTLVLATIASERLADGLTLSVLFILYAILSGAAVNKNILLVAILFFLATAFIMGILFCKKHVFNFANKLSNKFNSKAGDYAADRLQVFINGLRPLFQKNRLPYIIGFSIMVWMVELTAYYCIVRAFDAELSFWGCVLFLVAVNFSSLVPSAPAGIGVIEAFASAALVTVGINRELALSMVISQHLIQFMVIAVPGIIFLISFKSYLKNYQKEEAAKKQKGNSKDSLAHV